MSGLRDGTANPAPISTSFPFVRRLQLAAQERRCPFRVIGSSIATESHPRTSGTLMSPQILKGRARSSAPGAKDHLLFWWPLTPAGGCPSPFGTAFVRVRNRRLLLSPLPINALGESKMFARGSLIRGCLPKTGNEKSRNRCTPFSLYFRTR